MPLPSGITRVKSRSGKVYWYHQERRGKPDAGPRTTLPEFGTPEFWREVARLTGIAQQPANTVRSLIETYQQQPEWQRHRPATLRAYKAALSHIETAWGALDPAAISVAGVMALRSRFADRPAMGNMVLLQVRLLMRLAVQLGMRLDNPAREVGALDEDPDGAKPLTDAAWAALMSTDTPVDLRRYAVLGRATGQRISDVLRMRPADRDQDGIALTVTKLRDKEHWCPLSPSEAREIDGWNVFKRAPYVTRDDGRPHTEQSFRRAWAAFAETEAGAALRGFTSHDMRATKVCDERIRGTSHQQIAAKVGMSLGMVMKYSAHIDQRLAARGTPAERSREKIGNRVKKDNR